MESEITTLRILIKISLYNDQRYFRTLEEDCPFLMNLHSVHESKPNNEKSMANLSLT